MTKRTGMFLALCSAALYCVWAFAIPPLAAPDEPAHLQTVMELRKTWRLPEVHYAFDSDPRGVPVGSPGDASVREYAATFGIHPREQVPYESMQPPLYYLAVAAASYLVPLEPAPVMYL